jgi:uncharacterized protein YggE
MKQIIFILLTVFSVTSFAQIGEKNFIDQNYIEVTGQAEMEVVPNEIYLQILINEKDYKGKQEVQQLEKSMIDKLTEIGIDVSKQLVIKDMASNFQKYWLRGAETNSIKEYQLKVTDAKTAGRVIQELEALGISNISIEKVDHSEIEKLKTEVKVNAVKAAKEKAVALTNAVSQNIGRAIYIQEINNQIYRAQMSSVSNMVVRDVAKMEANQQPDIEFEKIKLEYSILVRFAME